MIASHRRTLGSILFACIAAVGPAPPLPAQAALPTGKVAGCDLDLDLPGVMRDILSNALVRGLDRPAREVAPYLDAERPRCKTGQELLQATARQFAIEPATLIAEVERFRHCDCKHALLPHHVPPPAVVPDEVPAVPSTTGVKVTPFARDVLLHVVLHEVGHALVREFDLPVLANEEAMADAFATHYLVHHMPDRAAAVLEARVASWMIEAGEVPRAEWPVTGEHDHDARRAFQVAALAVAVDAQKYAKVAELAGMSARDVQKAGDYGTEVHRSWRRRLRPLWMQPGESDEARVECPADDPLFAQLHALGLVQELERAVRRFDWHSQVTIRFVAGGGTAGWSRASRTVTVKSQYLLRFVEQGKRAKT